MDECDLIEEYLKFVEETAQELGSFKEIAYIREMIRVGSGADRQLKVWRETQDLKAVVDYMAKETRVGL